MGGLIARHYIHAFMPPSPDGRPQISHLVMLGTPNLGSPCADVMDATFGVLGKTVEAVRQLKPSVVAEFNRVTTNRKGVKFSALAGNPLPVLCKSVAPNDGVVPVESAIWHVRDNALSKNVHTDLTGTEDFSSFVKPRLAVGPKGNHNPEAPEQAAFRVRDGGDTSNGFAPLFINASYTPGANSYASQAARDTGADDFRPAFAKELTLAPKQTVEVEIPVPAGSDFGVTFMADANVSATLTDERGALRGKNLAGSPESRGFFRTIFVERVAGGSVWKLKLENTGALGASVVVSAWSGAASKGR